MKSLGGLVPREKQGDIRTLLNSQLCSSNFLLLGPSALSIGSRLLLLLLGERISTRASEEMHRSMYLESRVALWSDLPLTIS